MAKARKSKSTGGLAKLANDELFRLERILKLMSRNQVAELEWEKNGERLRLRSHTGAASFDEEIETVTLRQGTIRTAMAVPAPVPELPAPVGGKASAASNQKQITSPFVGTFYRAASPTADPYVREGQVVKRGDVLCIIEAMKLMNEIEAEMAGKVVSVLVENGQPVEFGEPLFMIEV